MATRAHAHPTHQLPASPPLPHHLPSPSLLIERTQLRSWLLGLSPPTSVPSPLPPALLAPGGLPSPDHPPTASIPPGASPQPAPVHALPPYTGATGLLALVFSAHAATAYRAIGAAEHLLDALAPCRLDALDIGLLATLPATGTPMPAPPPPPPTPPQPMHQVHSEQQMPLGAGELHGTSAEVCISEKGTMSPSAQRPSSQLVPGGGTGSSKSCQPTHGAVIGGGAVGGAARLRMQLRFLQADSAISAEDWPAAHMVGVHSTFLPSLSPPPPLLPPPSAPAARRVIL